ncbi:MAG: alpha,alpha-trehalase TreA [Tunicatimonas sp.]|uniref:alpha,alpha-trehalase TreA n=1 Tax=Tunicatimonas sp. TaxID=1940096 RepID=UPI003C746782
MKLLRSTFFLSFLLVSGSILAQSSPDELYPDLFRAVQLEPIFEDSKTFPDCIPKTSVQAINQAYAQQKSRSNFRLNEFVEKYFELPVNPASGFQTDTANSIEEHIEELWPVLTREPRSETNGSLINLPNPYVVPGGRFREIYYWDSYFTMLGLAIDQQADLIENMVDNFAYLIDEVGFIPNGNRAYYTSRSQPPFFSLMVRLLADIQGDDVLTRYLPQLQKEYDFWMDGATSLTKTNSAYRRVVLLDKAVLNRYWDDRPVPRPEAYKEDVAVAASVGDVPKGVVYRNIRAACESGWDFSSRWFRDAQNLNTIRTTELIPVDLNSLLYHLEIVLSEAYARNEQPDLQRKFEKLAKDRHRAIRKYCWNSTERFYFDYDFVLGEMTNEYTLAASYPLFFKIARVREARGVMRTLKREFLLPGGLRTTLNATGQQWDAPNGWAPLQWMAVQGLNNYGYTELTNDISQRWIDNNQRVYQNTGKLVEKYNVRDVSLEAGGGEYPVQDGFGWSNGVLLKLMDITVDQ